MTDYATFYLGVTEDLKTAQAVYDNAIKQKTTCDALAAAALSQLIILQGIQAGLLSMPVVSKTISALDDQIKG